MSEMGIYAITRIPTGEIVYIGSSSQISIRLSNHRKRLR